VQFVSSIAEDGTAPEGERRELFAAVLTMVVLLAAGAVTYAISRDDPSPTARIPPAEWAAKQGFADNAAAVSGARLFTNSGCTTCHTYLGNGTSSGDAPDLSVIGATDKGAAFFVRFVANPAQFGVTDMHAYGKAAGGALDERRLSRLGAFLDASRG
jgi:mono/diheme cytochrome c family protein